MSEWLDDATLRNVIEAAPDGFLIVDLGGRIVFANAQAATMFSYSRDELIGEQVEVLVPERFGKRHQGYRSEYARQPSLRPMGVGLDLLGRRRDGTEVPVEISLSPIQTTDRRFVACVIRDVTDRRQAQAEVRRSYALLNAVVEGTTDAIYVKDLQGRYLMINAAGARFIGLQPEEIVGRDDLQLFTPQTARAMMASDREIVASGETRTLEERATAAGTTRVYHVTKAPFRDGESKVIGLVGVGRDISERKVAEEALRLSEERFRLLVDGLRDYAIFMLDPEGCVSSWNAAAQRITGFRAEEIIGRYCSIFYPREDIERGAPVAELAQAEKDGRCEVEGWRVRKDGGQYLSNVMTAALLKDDGRPLGFAMVVRDVTERRRLEDERERLLTEAEGQRERERIAMDLHDGVIQSIYAATLVLEDAAHRINEEPLAARERVDRATDTLTHVIEEIRSYIMDLRPRFTHPADLAHALTGLVKHLETAAETEASFRVEGSLENLGESEAVAIYRIAQEALNNIAKHSQASRVDVLLSSTNGNVHLDVVDDGVGFDSRQRRPSAHQGLRNMSERARELKGKLQVESEPGKGTHVSLSLPLE